jgi:hypothetical protein
MLKTVDDIAPDNMQRKDLIEINLVQSNILKMGDAG